MSQQIARLEAQAGVKLLDRQPKGIKLTPAGEALVRHTERILAQLAEAQAELTEIASQRAGACGSPRSRPRPAPSSRSRSRRSAIFARACGSTSS